MNLILLREIDAEYRKHDWKLQTILIASATGDLPDDEIGKIFGKVEIRPSAINAAWFSRPPSGGRQAWELRLISGQPFALFEAFPDNLSEDQRERVRNEMETRMTNLSSQKQVVLPDN